LRRRLFPTIIAAVKTVHGERGATMKHPRSAQYATGIFLTTALLIGTAVGAAAQASYDNEFTSRARTRAYANDLFGVSAIVGVVGGAALDQWRDEPEGWDDDAEGFGRRLASNAGRHAANQSVRHGLAIVMGRTTRYHRCTCSGFFSRAGHAIVETVTDHGRDGTRMISIPRFGGAAAGAFVENWWLPSNDKNEILLDMARSVGYGALSNIAKEVIGWPR
jgi:hypothetical protein